MVARSTESELRACRFAGAAEPPTLEELALREGAIDAGAFRSEYQYLSVDLASPCRVGPRIFSSLRGDVRRQHRQMRLLAGNVRADGV